MTQALRREEVGIRYPFPEPPAPNTVIEVAPGIHWARLPLPMALDHVNVYALDDGDGWTVIDTGFATRAAREAWTALMNGPLAAKPVKRVVVTHHHPDHIGLAGWFQTEFGVELITTRTAWLLARMLVLDKQSAPDPQTIAFWKAAGMDKDELTKRLTDKPFNFADVVASLPVGFTRIKEGDVFAMGGRRWVVRCGNGHAPEHATFWSLDDDLVIGGDQLLPGISANLGVYPTEPEADTVAEWLESCQALGAFAEDRHLVLPGHKMPFTGLPLRLRQMIENHLGALDRLEAFLVDPHTTAECFVPIFKREIRGADYGMALVEAVAHMNHLHAKGRIKRTRRDDGAWLWQRC